MLIVGIGEYAISNNINEHIITYALGSCVAFMLHCPITKNTALAHIVLPTSELYGQTGYIKNKPGYFADYIVPRLIEDFLERKNCQKNKLEVFLAGGAISNNPDDIFKVGTKNVEMIKYLLREYKIIPQKAEVGGLMSRTVKISVASGQVSIKSHKIII